MKSTELRDIAGYEGVYKISQCGDIYSVRTGKIRKSFVTPDGYKSVRLCKDGVSKNHSVHRLVACAYLPPDSDKKYVNHKNGDRLDNRVANLEWCTQSENIKHSYAVLGRKMSAPLRNICIATRKKVQRDDGVVYESIRKAAEDNGTTTASLSQILRLYPMNMKNGHRFSFYKENE